MFFRDRAVARISLRGSRSFKHNSASLSMVNTGSQDVSGIGPKMPQIHCIVVIIVFTCHFCVVYQCTLNVIPTRDVDRNTPV